MRRLRQVGRAGFTLVELTIAIVVVGIAAGAVLLVMNYTTSHSADPMLQRQAVAIAEAYLEEILLKPFNDPNGGEPEALRTQFDDVDDYDGLADTTGARDQDDNLIGGLEAYDVTVAVTATTLNAIPALQVVVTVAEPSGATITLTGFRTDY